ncbi:MAG: MFS transporter [Nitrososphaerales archaeon]
MQKSTTIPPLLILATYMGLYFFSQFHRTAIGPLAGEFMREFGVSAFGVGVLTSSYFIIYGLLQPIYGVAIDNYGSNRVILFTMPLYVVACFLFAISPSFDMLIASRIVVAAAIASVYVAGLKATALSFKSASYGKVVGIYTGWGYTSSLLGMIIPSVMLGQGLSWRQTFIGVAGASLIFYLFFVLFIARNVTEADVKSASEPSMIRLKTLFSPHLILIYVTVLVAYGSYVGLVSWIPKYLYDVFGLERNISGIVAAIPAAMMAIGSPIMGLLADRRGSWSRIYKFSHLLTTFLLAALLYTVIMGDVLLTTLSFSSAMLALSGFTIWPAILRKERGEDSLGLILSIVNTFAFLGAFAYPALMGFVIDLFTPQMVVAGERIYGYDAYFWAFTLCFSTMVVSTTLIFKWISGKG